MNYTILDNIFEPACVISYPDSKIQYFNHHFPTFTKTTPRHLNKEIIWYTLFNNIADDFNNLITNAIEKQIPIVGSEHTLQIKNDQSQSTVVIKYIPIDNQTILIVFNDLSIEKRLFEKYKNQMQELKSNHEQIIQADKLKILGELTASISHEISNPLTIASGSLEFIKMEIDELEESDQKQEILSEIDDLFDSLNRINDIINNMKNFLHQKQEDKEYHLASEIINRSVELVKPALNDFGIEVNINLSDPQIILHANRLRLEQVLVNLLNNSIQALTSAKTTIPYINISLENQKHNIILTLSDNGPGIDKQIQGKIFDSFFTTKKMGDGTGLGLSICRKIIESHHGKIDYLENPLGATFQITLPIIELGSYSNSKMSSQLKNETNNNKFKILVLDNEPQVLNIIQRFLTEEGHTFLGATDPTSALSMALDLDVDLIITDILMPKMSGHEFAKKIRANLPAIPILYLSAKENLDYYLKDQKDLNISGIIFKPFLKNEFFETFYTVLKSETDGASK